MKKLLFVLAFIAVCGVSLSYANVKTVPAKSKVTIVTVEKNQAVAQENDKKDKKAKKSGCCAKKSKECPKAEKKCCAESKKDCPKKKKECKK